MKKAITIAAFLVLVVVAAALAFKYSPRTSTPVVAQGSDRAASTLQTKIDTIKIADEDKNRQQQRKLDVSEAELEAYALVHLTKQMPFPMQSIRVHLTPGVVAADTRLTIPSGSTGNVLLDALVDGTHEFNLKGKLTGARGVGRLDLQEVEVDGIPVPTIVVDALIKKYAKPKYPDVNIKEPFDLPWGIDAVDIGQGKATITY
jgi:antitoxin component HigA of HigAB toxin-antitoxin module